MAGLTTVTSGGIADGTISNADINSSAAIDASKVSGLSTDSITEGNTTVEVVDSGSDGHITFDTEGSERMRINSDGNLLIGSNGSSRNFFSTIPSTLQIEGTGSGALTRGSLSIINNATGDNPVYIALGKTGANGIGDTTIVGSNQWIGTLTWHGHDGTEFEEASAIRCHVDGTPGTNAMPGRLSFLTNSGGTGVTERMRINSSGNVGIGTTSPSAILEVVSNTTPQLKIGMANDADRASLMHNGSDLYLDTTAGSLVFRGASNTERMRIDANGKVGIGTTTPAEKLHVKTTSGFAAQFENSNDSSGLFVYNTGNSHARISFAGSDSTLSATVGSRANHIVFDTNANERMRITSGGKVGIGTDSNTTYNLQVVGTSSGDHFAIGDSSPRLILDYKTPSAATGITRITSNGEGLFYYGNTNTGNSAHYFHAGAGNSEKVRIDGDGLKFNGDTSSVNALHDYEEGNWTPSLIGSSGSAGSYATSVQSGNYVKVGSLVTVTGYVTLTNAGSYSGTARIGGLPFTCRNNAGAYGASKGYYTNFTLTNAILGCYPNIGYDHCTIFYNNLSGGAASLSHTYVNNNSQWGAFTLTYRTD